MLHICCVDNHRLYIVYCIYLSAIPPVRDVVLGRVQRLPLTELKVSEVPMIEEMINDGRGVYSDFQRFATACIFIILYIVYFKNNGLSHVVLRLQILFITIIVTIIIVCGRVKSIAVNPCMLCYVLCRCAIITTAVVCRETLCTALICIFRRD